MIEALNDLERHSWILDEYRSEAWDAAERSPAENLYRQLRNGCGVNVLLTEHLDRHLGHSDGRIRL